MSEETIQGVEELTSSLHQFAENIQSNIMTGAVRAGCKPIVKAAKENVPKRTKELYNSIGIIKRKSKDKSQLRFSVTPRRGGKYNGFYAHQVEFGNVHQEAQPFMRPALNESDNCITEAKKYMAKRIDKEIQKARK